MTQPSSSADFTKLAADAERAVRAGDLVEAQRCFEHLLRLHPGHAPSWSDLGVTLRLRGHPAEALICTRRALELAPDFLAPLKNLGNMLKDLGRIDEAIASHRQAVASDPQDATAWHNFAIALIQARQFKEAIDAIDQAIALSPSDQTMIFERALVHLRCGRYPEGWRDYESRWAMPAAGKRSFPLPKWDGSSLAGASIYIHAEQGFGDSILAARFLPALKRTGAHVNLECRDELRRLFTGLDGVDEMFGPGVYPTAARAQCPMMSLPGFLGIRAETIPPPARLNVPAEARRKAAALIPANNRIFKVGIVWSGSVTFQENKWRSCGVEHFLRLLEVPGVRLCSLQKGPPREDLRKLGTSLVIEDIADHLEDFADTAAVLERLDLVIMTDSSTAHLAGSLGLPCWNLLQYVPYWIYDTGIDRTPWYPSMRLFRQRRWGDWTSVVEDVCRALGQFVKTRIQ